METVTKNYVTDYLSLANRDIMVKNEGQYVQRYVYGADSERVSVFLTYAEKTQRGQSGENLASDFAANDTEKVWYRHSLLNSALIAVDKNGEQVVHMSYDAWGNPETETKLDENFAGIDNLNNFTGYTYDETLELYFAQNRFYDPKSHRFTQQDPVKDGENWYAYCGSNPLYWIDPFGLLQYIPFYINGTRYDNMAFIEKGVTYISTKQALEFSQKSNVGNVSFQNTGKRKVQTTHGVITVQDVMQTYKVSGQTFYFETFGCEQGYRFRDITKAGSVDHTVSWWKENSTMNVVLNSAMKDSDLRVVRAGNTVNIFANVTIIGGNYKFNNVAEAKARFGNDIDAALYKSDKTVKQLFIDGIVSNWSKTVAPSEYDLFGDYSSIKTNVYITETKDSSFKIMLDTDTPTDKKATEISNNPSKSGVLSNWNIGASHTINMYDHYWGVASNGTFTHEEYTVDRFKQTAAHEFGHSLGLGDAYDTSWHDKATPNPEVPNWDMMRSNRQISANNVEMLLEAWKTNRWQEFVDSSSYSKSTVIRRS